MERKETGSIFEVVFCKSPEGNSVADERKAKFIFHMQTASFPVSVRL